MNAHECGQWSMYAGEAEVWRRRRRRQEGQTDRIRHLLILALLTLDLVSSWVPVVAQASLEPLILLSLVEKQPLNTVIESDLSVAHGKVFVSHL